MTATFKKDNILSLITLAKKMVEQEYTKQVDAHARFCDKEKKRFFLWRCKPGPTISMKMIEAEIHLFACMKGLIEHSDSQDIQINQDEFAVILSWAGTNASLSGNGEVG